ncbi:MAG: hypothetical protein EXQ96_06655 [Alphaproteobacteria bacterium]|nr:hypothetical protein [Alphaproteobacteria bacterium]
MSLRGRGGAGGGRRGGAAAVRHGLLRDFPRRYHRRRHPGQDRGADRRRRRPCAGRAARGPLPRYLWAGARQHSGRPATGGGDDRFLGRRIGRLSLRAGGERQRGERGRPLPAERPRHRDRGRPRWAGGCRGVHLRRARPRPRQPRGPCPAGQARRGQGAGAPFVKLSVGRVVAAVAVIAGGALILVPGLVPLSPLEARVTGLVVMTVGLLASATVPDYLPALGYFVLAMALGVAPGAVIFSSFHTASIWLLVGGIIISATAQRTGLGERIAQPIVRHLPRGHSGIIAVVALITVGLAFLVPTGIGRMLILLPIMRGLADQLGFRPGRPGRTAIMLTFVFCSFFPPLAILPANLSQVILIGTSEALYGYIPKYGAYLALHFPVLGVLKLIAIVGSVCWLFPDRPAERAATPAPKRMSREQRRMLFILTVALIGWATDFIHHVSPAWISLGAAVLCLMPPRPLIPGPQFGREVSFAPLFYVAAILSIGPLLAHVGLSAGIGQALDHVVSLSPEAPFGNFMTLVLMAVGVSLSSSAVVPAILTPLAARFAEMTGFSLEAVIMTQVVAYTAILLPHQTVPLMFGITIAEIHVADATRLLLLLGLITILILLPLDYLWWRLLGVI